MVRRYTAADIPDACAYRADPEIQRFQGLDPDPDAFHADLARMAGRAPLDDGGWLNLAVVGAADGAFLGDLGLDAGGPEGAVLIGLGLMPHARRRGLARELVDGTLDWLHDRGIGWAIAEVDLRNGASLALFAACGFERAGEAEDDEGAYAILARVP